VPAALMMSRLSGIVRSIMSYTDDVGLAMSQINDLMCSDSDDVRFASHLLGVVDPATHVFTFANGGHMPPEIRSRTGELSNPGNADSGSLIGIDKGISFSVVAIPLAPGTSVILRTDGVDDAMSVKGEPYGVERFLNLLQRELADPETIGRELLADVRAYVAGHKQHDDITIMTFGRLA
jgi:sigma-B regulation protein RsbU (phosphoserine phosphatase)